MKSGLFWASIFAALASFGAAGCSREKSPEIVCTTGMVYDVVINVDGGHHTVGLLMGEGVDPHLYEATPKDARMLEKAKIVFYSGLHLEGYLQRVLERVEDKKPVVAITDGIPKEKLLKEGKTVDPHVWFDVELWIYTVDEVRDTLKKHDPDNAADYDRNAAAYKKKLVELHYRVQKEIASIPKQQRVMVTAHDAFRYFSRAYDIEVMSLQGISTVDEAALNKVNELVGSISKRKIKAIFIESSVPHKNMEAIVKGCAQKGHSVTIGGELFSDAMGELDTHEGTYIGMIEHNVRQIVDALK